MEPQRTQRNPLCSQKRRSKDRDIMRWKADWLVEDEVVFRDRGINHLEGTEGRERQFSLPPENG